ncbi:MAG: hypothetical protein KatS3mg002_0328 [Candidatus Woesearchaeota archaeon]|nr:MAG: hypothetical protein KatS3mg002_0328 [Candidatus Woesearchaeota archaeon]
MIEIRCDKCNRVITTLSDQEIDLIINRWESNLKITGKRKPDYTKMLEYFINDLIEIHKDKNCKVHYLNVSRR